MVPLQIVIHDGRTYEAKKKKSNPEGILEVMSSKNKKFKKSSPQNLPSLLNSFSNPKTEESSQNTS